MSISIVNGTVFVTEGDPDFTLCVQVDTVDNSATAGTIDILPMLTSASTATCKDALCNYST